MKRFFLNALTAVLTLALVLPIAAPVMANSEPEVKAQPVVMAALMVRNPDVADTNQPVTITVFGRYSHEPVAEAAVYALKANEMAITADKSDSTIVASFAATASEKGTLLGYTGGDGTVSYKFTETGKYLLLAVKNGFEPGFSRIVITLSASKGLDIRAPRTAKTGETFTIKVTERFTNQAVEGSAVYARKIRELTVPQAMTQTSVMQSTQSSGVIKQIFATVREAIKPNSTSVNEMTKYAADIQESGIFIGYTDSAGEVPCTFAQPGVYILIATKDNYAPGFAKITVNPGIQRKLAVKAPDKADVDELVTITVFERNTGATVSGAAVYALKVDDTKGCPMPLEAATSADIAGTAEVEKYATIALEKGSFIGYTDEFGQADNIFGETGRYILVTTKDGYKPGFARITITLSAPEALLIKARGEAYIGQQVTITVYTRQGHQPVAEAAVYALKWNVLPAPMPIENGTATQTLKPQPHYATEADKYAALATEDGEPIGYTNISGQVFHAFDEVGRYTLVAIKDDYTPDFTIVNVKPYRVKNPQEIEEVQPVLQSTTGIAPKALHLKKSK